MLVDTSVWIDHLRRSDAALVALLDQMQVSIHPFVVGEIACGLLANRSRIIGYLEALPTAPTVPNTNVMEFVDQHHLMGRGLGWIDMHLLASARLSGEQVLTRDRRLRAAAAALGLT